MLVGVQMEIFFNLLRIQKFVTGGKFKGSCINVVLVLKVSNHKKFFFSMKVFKALT